MSEKQISASDVWGLLGDLEVAARTSLWRSSAKESEKSVASLEAAADKDHDALQAAFHHAGRAAGFRDAIAVIAEAVSDAKKKLEASR